MQNAESYGDVYYDSEDSEEYSRNAIHIDSIEFVWEPYIPEKHDIYSCGNSFLDEFLGE